MQDGIALGATLTRTGARFAVWSGAAERMWVSIFQDEADTRHELTRGDDGIFTAEVRGLRAGARYGFRADGAYDPDNGLWFDPDKLLMDPYAIRIDRPYRYDPLLVARRGEGADTAALMPKAILISPKLSRPKRPVFKPGGFIYELNVRGFTMRHPDVPEAERGTIAALKHPAVIAHLTKLGVDAVELLPVTAWIDERHLPPLGLTNAWGYNPVSFMALDPRLAPGGIEELRETVAVLRKAGIGVILDLVFNHTGESDRLGPTLSLRGLDANAYYRHAGGQLVNDTGTGNTIACDHPAVRRLIVDSLRHFVLAAGVDGFRFDLAPILGRNAGGFDPNADMLRAIREDAILTDRVLIAEPWDIGPDGYQLGNFGTRWLEWNDRYRDDVRRFWRGGEGGVGDLATRLAGSSDIFQRSGGETRSVNFIAAHDGFALADIVAYERKHNEANGENNRDGHNENISWNNGFEGETSDGKIVLARRRDAMAMLATLFASRGTVMLTAGDEFGRTQHGNNNAYAQDNETTWLDWHSRDKELEEYVAALSEMRANASQLTGQKFLKGREGDFVGFSPADVTWLDEKGEGLRTTDWEDARRHRLSMVLGPDNAGDGSLAVLLNADRRASTFVLPRRDDYPWTLVCRDGGARMLSSDTILVPGRTVAFAREACVWDAFEGARHER